MSSAAKVRVRKRFKTYFPVQHGIGDLVGEGTGLEGQGFPGRDEFGRQLLARVLDRGLGAAAGLRNGFGLVLPQSLAVLSRSR